MKLDFLIPASPKTGFFSQIAFFRLCLNSIGGIYRNARVVAVFGDHTTEHLPSTWKQYLDGVDVEWAHPIGVENLSYKAQHDRRFEVIRKDADLAVLCDADVALLRPFDDMANQLIKNCALGGVIAHYHFPWEGRKTNANDDWTEIATTILGRDIERPYQYTLTPKSEPSSAPFYINYGMFAGPPNVLAEFYKRDVIIRERVAELLGHWWAPQVSVSLTCEDLHLPTLALPMRYNFPNDPIADSFYPDELDSIVFLHYLRLTEFRRDQIFTDESAFNKFINSNFTGSNEIFRRHVARVTSGNYPFP